jgi:hypothetical protein
VVQLLKGHAVKAGNETSLVRACLRYLSLRGIPAWRTNSGAMTVRGAGGKERFVRFNGAKGCSDLLGLLPPSGRFLAVECKMRGNKPTADQQGFLDVVAAAGGLAVVVHDVADLAEALDVEGY